MESSVLSAPSRGYSSSGIHPLWKARNMIPFPQSGTTAYLLQSWALKKGRGKKREKKKVSLPHLLYFQKVGRNTPLQEYTGRLKTKRVTRAYKLLVKQALSLCLRLDAKHRPESPPESAEVLSQLRRPVSCLCPVRQEAPAGHGPRKETECRGRQEVVPQ